MPVPLASLRPLASPGRSWPALLSALAQPSLGSHHRAGSETLRCSPHPHVHTTVDPGEQGPRLGAGRQGGKSRAAWEGAGAAPGGPRAGRGWRAPLTVMLGGGGPKWACLGGRNRWWGVAVGGVSCEWGVVCLLGRAGEGQAMSGRSQGPARLTVTVAGPWR